MTSARSPSKIIPRAFPGITADEVTELINGSELKNYPANTILCHEDQVEDTFYLILEGEVEVTKVINKTENRILKSLRAGDFFGEMALIHNAPRAATVRSVTSLITLEIRKESFDRVLRNSPSISLAMVREISRRLRENDEMAIGDLRLRASELADAYQRMAEMEAARSEFLTNVSHQLRTPLMVAGGYLQMLQKGAFPAEKVPETMETISLNVQKITSLINDILFLQEMELILEQFAPVDMVRLARKVADRFTEIIGLKRIHLHLKADLFLPSVMGDALSLERALLSLVDNAIKFSREKSEVEIRLRRKGNQLAVSVKDQGIGIDPEILPHIFDRFHHRDKGGEQLYDGLGIGLAITKQVIEQHYGRLEVESILGSGSTFTMYLNVSMEDGRLKIGGTTL